MIDVAARGLSFGASDTRDIPARWFWAGVAVIAAGVASLLAVLLHAWPPHEDEALALFVGRGSLPHVVHTVIAVRGGAPLHFVLAWAVVHFGGGLTALRVVSLLFAVASIPAQGVYIVLRGDRRRDAAVTLGAIAVAAIPFWWADAVLRGRFGVGVGGGGSRLGSPSAVAHYFWWVSGDFSAGHHEWSVPVLVVAAAGFVLLALRRRTGAMLTACVILVPALAFMLARLHATASPEARHLIFALPFFSTLLATTLVDVARFRPLVTAPIAIAALGALLVGEVRWAHEKTPLLFDGPPAAEVQARSDASAWLASRARRDDVLLGYEPLYLTAWEKNRSFSKHVLPRADPILMASALERLTTPLGRGVWVLDASDSTNTWKRPRIRYAVPQPGRLFEAHAFGPYLVVRTRRAVRTRARYVAAAEAVMRLGKSLAIGDADVNLNTLVGAGRRIYGESGSRSSSRSRSTISR